MTGTDEPLMVSQLTYADGALPRILDIIRIPLLAPAPTPYQPENWRIGVDQWVLVGRYGFEDLELLTHPGVSLLHNESDRVPAGVLADVCTTGPSLALVAPDHPEFYCRQRADGRKSLRCRFGYHDSIYDLAVTDLFFERVHREMVHSSWRPHEDLYFTISLGTAFEGYHYKLIAGVIPDPDGELWSTVYR